MPGGPALAQSCEAARPAWDEASRTNTADALIDYINEHGPCFTGEAIDQLNTLGGAEGDAARGAGTGTGTDGAAGDTVDVEAGPIWNNDFAAATCPGVCGGGGRQWTGAWRTTVAGEMSVCGCR